MEVDSSCVDLSLQVVVVLLFYVHGKHLRSYRDGQLTNPHFSWAGLDQYFVHILLPVTDNCPSRISGRRNESMWPDRVSNPGPLTYKPGALPTALRGPESLEVSLQKRNYVYLGDEQIGGKNK